jgi:putative (di)nucleoside polyphosphate hydrolase
VAPAYVPVGTQLRQRRGGVVGVRAQRRADFPGEWQLPQGGIDVDEMPRRRRLARARRGDRSRTDDVELVDEHPDWTAYEFPDRPVRGQRSARSGQRWYVFRVTDDDVSPNPTASSSSTGDGSSGLAVEHVVEFRRVVPTGVSDPMAVAGGPRT